MPCNGVCASAEAGISHITKLRRSRPHRAVQPARLRSSIFIDEIAARQGDKTTAGSDGDDAAPPAGEHADHDPRQVQQPGRKDKSCREDKGVGGARQLDAMGMAMRIANMPTTASAAVIGSWRADATNVPRTTTERAINNSPAGSSTPIMPSAP